MNISRIGIIAQNELSDMNNINETCFQDTIERHNGFIVGMKARMSKSVVGENGITPLIKAKEMQKKHHLPLMVHIGNNPQILMKLPIYSPVGISLLTALMASQIKF